MALQLSSLNPRGFSEHQGAVAQLLEYRLVEPVVVLSPVRLLTTTDLFVSKRFVSFPHGSGAVLKSVEAVLWQQEHA